MFWNRAQKLKDIEHKVRLKVAEEMSLEYQALALLPGPGVNLSGNWYSIEHVDNEFVGIPILLGQFGITVSGTRAAIEGERLQLIRGILWDGHLVGTIWCQDRDRLGSGMLNLKIEEGGQYLRGQSFYREAGSDTLVGKFLCWRRQEVEAPAGASAT